MFEPRSAQTILQDLLAGVVGRSGLTDTSEGSVIAQILSTVAVEMASAEYRLAAIRDSFFFGAVGGSDLDDRVAELPPDGIQRLPPTNAVGGALSITREGSAAALVLPAGSQFGRIDAPDVLYSTTIERTFAVGVLVLADVQVVCAIPGEIGNVGPGVINKIVTAPADVVSVTQEAACTGGQITETDEQLRYRALSYLGSLARCQPAAIEHAVTSHVATDGTRVRYASIYEDPERPGYSEMVIDDGSALQGVVKPGRIVEGFVPDGGVGLLYHEGPAVQPIQRIQRFVYPGGAEQDPLTPDQFVSIPERGIVYIVDADALDPGDKWRISDYDVWGGALVPEIQRLIEGDINDPVANPGLRAAGTRVRAVPPRVQLTSIDIHIVPEQGVIFTETAEAVELGVIDYLGTLRPGEPLRVAALVDRMMDNDDLHNVHMYEGNSATRLSDTYPMGPRHVIRTDRDHLRIVPEQEL